MKEVYAAAREIESVDALESYEVPRRFNERTYAILYPPQIDINKVIEQVREKIATTNASYPFLIKMHEDLVGHISPIGIDDFPPSEMKDAKPPRFQ